MIILNNLEIFRYDNGGFQRSKSESRSKRIKSSCSWSQGKYGFAVPRAKSDSKSLTKRK